MLPFADPHPRGRPRSADGRRHCGSLEAIVWRQWDAALLPPPEVVEAIDRLAELPEQIKEKLAAGLDAIFVGPGGVPELDEMTALRGVRLPSGRHRGTRARVPTASARSWSARSLPPRRT